MNRLLIFPAICILASHSIATHGYEQATHAKITQFAYVWSRLGPDSSGDLAPLARALGLDHYAPLGDGKDYFETGTRYSQGAPIPHRTQPYELDILDQLDAEFETDPLRAWLMYGAIREDDNRDEDPPTPRDIFPPLSRPLSHFYDPYNDRALNSAFLSALGDEINKAPDWAIGSPDAFTIPNTPQTPRFNTFTVFDAREAMLRALTLKSYDGSAYVDVAGAGDPSEKQRLRRMYWATVFRALGDVLHVNQDMAQPQHTRNEPHAGKYCSWIPGCPGGHSSVYEKYMKARALGTKNFELKQPYDTPIDIWPLEMSAGSYPIPTFASYVDYWSTAKGTASLTGKGLANYSNQGFFSAARNFDSTDYPSPPHRMDAYAVRTMPVRRWDGSTPADATPTYVFFGPVADAAQGAVTNDVPLTTFGLWDQFLQKQGALPRYTLNRLNYDAMANLLIPRAVSYSAGLINYFFRGVLEITRPDEGVFALADHADPKGFTKIRTKLRNQTPDFATPDGIPRVQTMDGGDLIAVVRYHKDLKYVPDLAEAVGVAPCNTPLSIVVEKDPDASTECRDGAEEILVSEPVLGKSLAQGAVDLVEFDFSAKPIPFGITDAVLQVVYRGALGDETNSIAVGTVDLSEPTYFTYQNATDYIRIGDQVYTRDEVDRDPALLTQVQPRSCVDERISPPHLQPYCLNPFKVDLKVAFDDLAQPIATIDGLAERRFIRFAFLTVAGEGAQTALKSARRNGLRISAERHGSTRKASLQQDGTCLPHNPIDAKPRLAQLDLISWQSFTVKNYEMKPLRGVNGWINASCVVNGSDADPGTPDDRVQVMKPLMPDSDEIKPLPVIIMSKYLSDAD